MRRGFGLVLAGGQLMRYDKKIIPGVLGGMGPAATVDFIARVIALTAADRDQDHIPMIIYHNPAVPNRQAALVDGGEDPSVMISKMGSTLEAAGADFLVMPCNSAHAFVDLLRQTTTIPLVSIIDVTADACAQFETVAILATDGCLISRSYQNALAARGIQWILPSPCQLIELMTLISRIKAGDTGQRVRASMRHLARNMIAAGAQAIVAACTEIPLVLDSTDKSVPVVSSTEELAKATFAEVQRRRLAK